MGVLQFIAVICCLLPLTIAEPATYVITAPQTMRAGLPFDINIVTRNVATTNIRAQILHKDNSTFAETTWKSFAAGIPDVISIDVPVDVPDMSYNIRITGDGGATFVNQSTIKVSQKTSAVFIQLDKKLYKPSQEVKFRTFAVTPSLMKYTAAMEIIISDPNTNRIMQIHPDPSELTQGVYSGRFGLSDEPVMGDWTIKVTIGQETAEKIFTVDEYVLPKFEVTVDLPSYYIMEMGSIPVKVKADYTYGQPVKGNANVMVQWKPTNYQSQYVFLKRNYSAELKDGKYEFTLTKKDLLHLCNATNPQSSYQPTICYVNRETREWTNLPQNELMVVANVTDAASGKTYSGENSVMMSNTKYKVEFIATPEVFKSGLTFTGYVKVTQPDGKPPSEFATMSEAELQSTMVNISLYMKYSTPIHSDDGSKTDPDNKRDMISVPLDRTGLAKFTYDVPSPHETMDLTATFGGQRAYKNTKAFKSRDQQGIQVMLVDQQGPVQDQQTVQVKVQTTQAITTFYYVVMSKGRMVSSSAISFSASTENTFTYTVSGRDLAPKASLVVYYITDSGELIVDSLIFQVAGAFSNDVNVAFNKEKASPADMISLTVTADPMSFIGILAVDKSVQLLGTGNDIVQGDVFSALEEFDLSNKNDHSNPCFGGRCPVMAQRRKKRSFWMPWPMPASGTDAQTLFDNAGVLVFTNAFMFKEESDFGGSFGCPRGAMCAIGPRGGVAARGPEGMPGAPGDQGLKGRISGEQGPPGAMVPDVDDNGMELEDGGSSMADVGRTRVVFPETWLWTDSEAGADGSIIIETTLPDSLTTWTATAFAMSDVGGLGITDQPANVIVSKDFFVTWNTPYSIIRGERFGAQAIVYNYMSKDLDALVTMKIADGFEFRKGDKDPKVTFTIDANGDARQRVQVPANDARSAYFWIKPTKIGTIDLEVKAQTTLSADAVRRTLIVEPEGIMVVNSQTALVDLSSGQPFRTEFTVDYDNKLVMGSERVTCTAIGDMMGPSITGLDSLLRMPSGCGEQNMLNFAPNIYVLNYLEATDQADSKIRAKAMNNMAKGYQRELTYMHTGGGFSAFGNRDPSPSTWLTAFVVKCFQEAKHQNYINSDNDNSLLKESLMWMTNQQNENGSFNEPGRVIHKDMQGGSSSGITLTAYVLISMAENQRIFLQSSSQDTQRDDFLLKLNKAKVYLEGQLSKLEDTYALAITTYALTVVGSSEKEAALAKLEEKAIMKDGMKYWTDKDDTTEENEKDLPYYYRKSSSKEVEMTSYGLLTYAVRADIMTGLPVAKWMSIQRNAYGGFRSTQDTVLGMQAMGTFLEMTKSEGEQSVDITIQATDGGSHTFNTITADNSLVLHQVELSDRPGTIVVEATGRGSALVQCTVQNHVTELPKPEPEVELEVDSEQNSDTKEIIIEICARWKSASMSGMVVIEVGQLTAHEPDEDMLKNLVTDKVVKRMEKDGRKVVLYFDELTQKKVCLKMKSRPMQEIENLQGGIVKAFPYYQPEYEETKVYLPVALQLIADKADPGSGEPAGATHTTTSLGFLATILMATVVSLLW